VVDVVDGASDFNPAVEAIRISFPALNMHCRRTIRRHGVSVARRRVHRRIRLLLISDVGNLRLFEASPDLEIHTSAAAEAALLLGLVAIIAAPSR